MRSDSSGDAEPTELKIKASDIAKKRSTYSFVIQDKTPKPNVMPEKVGPIKRVSTNDELSAFLSKFDNE